ncbi:MAG: HAMP domain-containing sensor histidine kinase [Candidatus Zixiibacteriota bacterium]
MNRYSRIHLRPFFITLLALLFLWTVDTAAVERLHIRYAYDDTWLPYTLDVVFTREEGIGRAATIRPAHVLKVGHVGESPARMVAVLNPYGSPEAAAIASNIEYPWRVKSQVRIPLPVTDVLAYRDSRTGQNEVAAAMLGEDSAWVIRLYPETGTMDSIFLCSLSRHTGGAGEPRMLMLLAEDYDYDGQCEVFVYMYSPRPGDPRGVYCVDMEARRVEWSVPVATPVLWYNFMNLRDSIDPGVIFCTSRQAIGLTDSVFDDNIGQLAVVNARGEITFCRTVVHRASTPMLRRGESHEYFYVGHNVDYESSDSETFVPGRSILTKIDRHGRALRSLRVNGAADDLWSREYGRPPQQAIWLMPAWSRVEIYDTALNLLAVTDTASLGKFMGEFRVSGIDEPVLIFQSGIFTTEFDQLAAIPINVSEVQSLYLDSAGKTSVFLFSGPNNYVVGSFQRRGIVEMLTVIYVNYQTPILMTLSGLVVALVLLNYFRYRAKASARLITQQKEELERTHQALKAAQATIVAQEKYRQARDIAGGFAHEIRNALFPAEAALYKMLAKKAPTVPDSMQSDRFARTAVEAVARAIGVTELISQYTKLDTEAALETVDLCKVVAEVFQANHMRIQEQQVAIEMPGDGGPWVQSNHRQLYMVFNNLVLNSLDALTECPDPRIVIEAKHEAGQVLVSVTDNGCGISASDLPRVFDTFFSTKPSKGNGLGLAIAKRIVELYGGSIDVSSEPGQWTRFVVRMKVSSPDGRVPTA